MNNPYSPEADPPCCPVVVPMLAADRARLARVATTWGVQPETLALTLVLDGLADIRREKQEAAA